jgi:hypothetical protein
MGRAKAKLPSGTMAVKAKYNSAVDPYFSTNNMKKLENILQNKLKRTKSAARLEHMLSGWHPVSIDPKPAKHLRPLQRNE